MKVNPATTTTDSVSGAPTGMGTRLAFTDDATTCAHDIREPISFHTWTDSKNHVIEWKRVTRCLSCGVRVVEEWGR